MPLPTIHAGGEPRKLGCLPRVAAVGSIVPVFGQCVPLIPRSQWKPTSLRHFVRRIMDQNGQAACNAFASAQCVEICRAIAGQLHVALSPGSLYGRINGGRDQGSVLGDALRELIERGICPETTIGPLQWQPRRWPADWESEAKRYAILESYDCPTFDAIASAVQLGFVVDYGVMTGRAFEVGSDGWVADQRGSGGGHALCGIGLAKKNGQWGIETANSWGTAWGDQGFAVVPESYFDGDFNDAWAVRSVVLPSDPAWQPIA